MTTIKPFLDDDFLLETKTAQRLYHEYAKDQPIIDYHCHLPPEEIAGNHQFENLTKIWLDGDHYKWRAMRTLGVDESYITGTATDAQKFGKWSESVPYTMRNPLYHWSHLELRRYFDINTIIGPETGKDIYEHATGLLNTPDYQVQSLITKMNVETICTTDDPVDDLGYHRQIKSSSFDVLVLPTFRPDNCLAIEQGETFIAYLEQLGNAAQIAITDLSSLFAALGNRMDFFHENGCRLSDHGLERIYAEAFDNDQADKLLKKACAGEQITTCEGDLFRSAMLHFLSVQYHKRDWTQQFHLGALRNNNARMEKTLGPNTGFDSIGDWSQASALSRFLNKLDSNDQLARTILYNLNPSDNPVLATMIGNFNDGSIRGKVQFGSGWWYLDQKDGMENQMNTLSNMGLLSCLIGMLTDSRSFLSYPRHEYFRRILCNLYANDVENGLLPNDVDWIGNLVKDISYRNAKNYFNFK